MKSLDKEIIRLAIPNILSNISIPLLSSVDTILMGGLSVEHLAAVGAGSMIFNMIYWNFGFLRMGTTGLCAQAYGRNDSVETASIFARSILLAIIIALVLWTLARPMLDASLSLFNVSAESASLVSAYFNVRIWAAPATMVMYVLLGWLFGMQNAILPLIITIVINVVNILASYAAVHYYGMETQGVALGTVIAQYCGVVILGIIMMSKYRTVFRSTRWTEVFEWKSYTKFFKINLDIFIRTACLTFVFSFFYSQSFKLGTLVIGVNVILQQFINWMSYGIDGFAYATESLVGKYKGANNKETLERMIQRSFLWGGVSALFFTLLYMLFGRSLMQMFSSDIDALELAYDLRYFIWIFPLLAFWSYIWDGIYVGLVASRSMRNSMLISLCVFLAVFYLYPESSVGVHIWVALTVFVVSRGLFQYILYRMYGTDLR